jgi:transposase
MDRTLYALDLAKQVFQVFWVEGHSRTREKRLKRAQVLEFFARVAPARVAMEACGGAHHWGRELAKLGHEVMLIHPGYVRAFVKTNKTDGADARAIWTAASQPEMRAVPVKTVDQQTILALHRVRQNRCDMRTALMNQLRGLLAEFGVVLKRGREAGLAELYARLAELEPKLPGTMMTLLREQCEWMRRLTQAVQELEGRIRAAHAGDEGFVQLTSIPGIGLLGASALRAQVGNGQQFRSGRQASAAVGIVPRQYGTGGKVRLGAISKRGDPYLRTLLIHGARSVIAKSKHHSPWLKALLARRPKNVAAVALANKNVRIAWALLTHGGRYEADHQARALAHAH